MLTELLRRHVAFEVDGADGRLSDGQLLQLLCEGRLCIDILRRDGPVAGLFQRLLVGCTVLLRQTDVVGVIVLLGSSHDISLRQTADALNLVEHILPRMAVGEGLNQFLRALANGLELLLGFHHHLALQVLHLLIAEMAVHDLLQLFHDVVLGGLHLVEQIGNDGDGGAGSVVEAGTHGEGHHQLVLVDERVEQSCLAVIQQFIGEVKGTGVGLVFRGSLEDQSLGTDERYG